MTEGEIVAAVLVVYGAIIAVGVSGRFFPIPDRAFRALATQLDLTVDGDTLRGTWCGVPVTVEREGWKVYCRAPAPPDVTMGGLNAAFGQHGERFRTGDGSIDGQLVIYGPRDRLVAALDGAARVQVRELLLGLNSPARVEGGRITRRLLPQELQPGTVAILLNTITELSTALHAAPDAPRLSGIARSDLYAAVRRNALDTLARLHPGAPTEAVARDLLDDRDLGVRIEAARLAGEPGTLHLVAADPADLDAAVVADPRGIVGRLAALPEATLVGVLARAHRPGRAVTAEALARVGSIGAVEPLLAAGYLAEARAIQARLGAGNRGALSLADGGGEVSLAPEAGAVALVGEVEAPPKIGAVTTVGEAAGAKR